MNKKQQIQLNKIMNSKMNISNQRKQNAIDKQWEKTFEKISPTGVLGKTFAPPSTLKKTKRFTF